MRTCKFHGRKIHRGESGWYRCLNKAKRNRPSSCWAQPLDGGHSRCFVPLVDQPLSEPHPPEHTCRDGNKVDCPACGEADCPWGDEEHYDDDGCPSCWGDPLMAFNELIQEAEDLLRASRPGLSADLQDARGAWWNSRKPGIEAQARLREIYEASGASEHAQILDMLRHARSGEGVRVAAEQRAEIAALRQQLAAALSDDAWTDALRQVTPEQVAQASGEEKEDE